MRKNTYENCIKEYKSFDSMDNKFISEHNKIIKDMSFSIVTEGLSDELSMAVQWCLDNIGKRKNIIGEDYNFRKLQESTPDGLWTELWYGKTGYDYGFSEFFFKHENDLNNFILQITNFHVTDSTGNKWKTDGVDSETKVS